VALWSFKSSSFTTEAVADANAYADNKYMGLMGGSTTQRLIIKEVRVGGQAIASAPQYLILSRDSTVQATPTALTTGQSNAALDPATAALAAPQIAFTASTTKPQRSATLGIANLSFNAFGGVALFQPALGEEPTILGNTASFGEMSLSGFTGTTPGLVGAHIMYEPL
jgi:hypothetical protein